MGWLSEEEEEPGSARVALRALQEVHARHVLPEGLDSEALAALAVGGAVVPDGRGRVLPLPPALRGAQAVFLRLVLQETGAQGGSNAGHRAGSQPSPSRLGEGGGEFCGRG